MILIESKDFDRTVLLPELLHQAMYYRVGQLNLPFTIRNKLINTHNVIYIRHRGLAWALNREMNWSIISEYSALH